MDLNKYTYIHTLISMLSSFMWSLSVTGRREKKSEIGKPGLIRSMVSEKKRFMDGRTTDGRAPAPRHYL